MAQKFSTTSLILLVFIGLLLALAIKGFAVLLALAETFASIAHNLLLQILFELGIIGGILCLFVLGKWLPSQQSKADIWRMGAWGAGIGTLMFSYNFWQSWLMASLLICALSAAILLPSNTAE